MLQGCLLLVVIVLFTTSATSSRWNHRIARLERDELVAEEGLVKEFMQGPLLNEVLVVDVAVPRRVDPYEVILPLVLNEGIAQKVTEAVVKCRNFLNSLLLLVLTDPVFRVTPPAFVISKNAMLTGSS